MEWFNQVAAAWRQALFALLRGAEKIPRHVAFIMDGNRRFANKQGIHRLMGHEHGCEKVTGISGESKTEGLCSLLKWFDGVWKWVCSM